MFLTAREAADRLGVKLDTLYAYVSRGRLRSVMVPGMRERRYREEDVAALLDTRGGARLPRGPDPEALMPVLGSAICLLERGRFFYRGRDVVRLAEGATLEEIAQLLWLDETSAEFSDASAGRRSRGTGESSSLIASGQIRLAVLGDEDLSALDLTRARVIRTGWRSLRELVTCVITSSLPSPDLVPRRLAAAWRMDEAGADLIRR